MPEATVIQGLTGTEIIEDFLNHLRTKLRRDCNLRDTDSYTRGYSATGSFKIQLFGMDTNVVDGEIEIVKGDLNDPDKVVTEVKIEIPQELELNEVRERSGLEEPILSTDADGKPEIRKRKYTRRIISEAVPEGTGITGGAEEFQE
jgi:hypothetical protein